METRRRKSEHFDEGHIKTMLEGYFSENVPYSLFMETTINMMKAFYKAFNTGAVTGRSVIVFPIAPIIVPLLPMKDFIEEMTVLVLNDVCLKELEKWKNKDPDAFDWSHVTDVFKELKGNSDGPEDEEEDLRGKIRKILKWDVSNANPGDPLLLPKADIVASIWSLDGVSKDHEDYRRNLRQLSNLISLGGYLLLYADVNASCFKVGEEKFHLLSCDESFYRKVISEEGFDIKHWEKFDRVMCSDQVDHETVLFIIACKLKEPQKGETS